LEAITGHKSSLVLSVYLRKEKSYTEQLGSFQPVRLLFSPTGHYKFQDFIYHTLEEETIDLRDKAAVKSVIDKLRVEFCDVSWLSGLQRDNVGHSFPTFECKSRALLLATHEFGKV